MKIMNMQNKKSILRDRADSCDQGIMVNKIFSNNYVTYFVLRVLIDPVKTITAAKII
jgi:hypothetical protein